MTEIILNLPKSGKIIKFGNLSKRESEQFGETNT